MEQKKDTPSLYLENIYQRYPDGRGGVKTVLNNIDLLVDRGEFITVVGPSGCGKSTLLRLILGSEPPSSGTILSDGDPLEGSDRHRGIVFQRYSLFPHLTVLENVATGLIWENTNLFQRFLKTSGFRQCAREYRERAAHYVERVGLGEHLDKYPNQLSGGQRQRVAIAQAVIMQPQILLMDEPFGALDDTTRQGMQLFILEQWKETKMTIFFVTHDLEEAVFLGTRILVLSQYYTADADSEGAKVVDDLSTPGDHPKSIDFKYSPDFNWLLKQIRNDGLDPNVRQHISEFNLSHPHAFRTFAPGEWRENGDKKGDA